MHKYGIKIVLGGALGLAIAASLRSQTPRELPADLDRFSDSLLEPKRPSAQQDADDVEAATHYLHARMLQQRGDAAGALRSYQRAWRYRPELVSVLGEILPLTLQLGRRHEASRYAVLAAEQQHVEDQFLQRMAAVLTEQQQWSRALGLYEKLLKRKRSATLDLEQLALHLEMGRLYFLAEQYDDAVRMFSPVRKAIQHPYGFRLRPADVRQALGNAEATYTVIGESFLRAGQFDAAEEMFQARAKAKPDRGRLAFDLARLRVADKRFAAARRQLDECLQAGYAGAGTQPYELLQKVLDATHETREAASQELLQQLTAAAGVHQNDTLNYWLAEQLHKRGETEEAKRLLEQNLERQPTIETYKHLLDIYAARSQVSRIVDLLAGKLRRDSSLEQLETQLQSIGTQRDLIDSLLADSDARRQSQELPARGPQAIAWLALAAERYDQANVWFERALLETAENRPQLLLDWGRALLNQQRPKAAAAIFQRALRQPASPKRMADLYDSLAQAQAAGGDIEAALQSAERGAALQESPLHAARRGRILLRAGRHDEARQAYRQLVMQLDANHDSREMRQSMRDARLELSDLCRRRNELSRAEEWLEQILDEFPDDAGVLNDLGYLWADQGKNLKRSLAMIRRAVAAEPDNPAFRDSLGWTLFRLGRFSEAVAELEMAAQSGPPDGVILDHLGDAYAKTDRLDQAVSAWQRAVRLFESQQQKAKLERTQEKLNNHRPR